MTTAGDQIDGALRLIGVLGENETPSTSMIDDCLMAMNQMLDSWSIAGLTVFSKQEQVFTWPANTTSRTLGLTGDLVGNRPVAIDSSTYFKDSTNTIKLPIYLIGVDDYNSLQASTSTYPDYLYVNMTVPNVTLSVYPVPTETTYLHCVSVVELTQPAAYSTALVIPPGYLRAFKFNLAVEIAPEFNIDPPAIVRNIAINSLRTIKRNNRKKEDNKLSLPSALSGVDESNILTG